MLNDVRVDITERTLADAQRVWEPGATEA